MLRISLFVATLGLGLSMPAGSTTFPYVFAPTPSSLDFKGHIVGTGSSTQTITFDTLTYDVATFTSNTITVPAGFTASPSCASGGTGICTVQVQFSPTATGPVSGSLEFFYCSAPISCIGSNVALSGVGEPSLVPHYYQSILQRAPDPSGEAFWNGEASRMENLGANVNEAWYAMAMSFFASAEYASFARDDAGFVTDLYDTFLNRAPDSTGFDYWTQQLAAGMPREVMLAAFMFSGEFLDYTRSLYGTPGSRPEVDMVGDFYRGLLWRLPDDIGFANWVGTFRIAQCAGANSVYAAVETISSAFANSAEYLSRNRTSSQYVGDLYNAFLRRGGDLAGVQYWIGQLDTGAMTREDVRRSFVASPEFAARVAAVVAQGCLP